jgi:hypothetical protein
VVNGTYRPGPSPIARTPFRTITNVESKTEPFDRRSGIGNVARAGYSGSQTTGLGEKPEGILFYEEVRARASLMTIFYRGSASQKRHALSHVMYMFNKHGRCM